MLQILALVEYKNLTLVEVFLVVLVLLEQLKRPSSFLILIGGLWLASSVLGLPVEPVDLASGAENMIRLLSCLC